MDHAWGRGHSLGSLAAVLFGLSCTMPADGTGEIGSRLSAADSAAVVAADQAYADAWLSGGEDPVMGTLHDDAVIVPSGLDAREGSEAMREFWFPANSPPTIVDRYELGQVEVGGSSALAYVRGTFALNFKYEGESYDSHGTYLTLLRPDEAGTWRISHRMWNDHPNTDRTEPTTVIVVRHAEKATGQGDDPHLSDAGTARSHALARALADAGVTAVIVSQYARTAETAAPTARAAGVSPEVVELKGSIPRHIADVSATVRRHPGGVVLVVGHSNTVADIVAALGAERPPDICDPEYDRMEIVDMAPNGRAWRIESRYGAPTPVEAGCASMR